MATRTVQVCTKKNPFKVIGKIIVGARVGKKSAGRAQTAGRKNPANNRQYGYVGQSRQRFDGATKRIYLQAYA